jgi:hypothetical protein
METNESQNNIKKFTSRLDYYWKSLSIYAVLLSIVFVIRESLSNVKFITAIYQPLTYLLIFFVVVTSIALLVQFYKKRYIEISESRIGLHSRNKSRYIQWSDIAKISIAYENVANKSFIKVIRLKVDKFKYYFINPTSYENEKELIEIILEKKKELKK